VEEAPKKFVTPILVLDVIVTLHNIYILTKEAPVKGISTLSVVRRPLPLR
jgi:hypothetical protein